MLCALLALVPVAACGDDGGGPDAAPIDALAPDTLPGCGADVLFTGEYVEWTSTETEFRGIFEALFTIDRTSRTDLTAPNGRVILCLTPGPMVRITATKADHTPAVFLADPEVFTPAGSTFTSRGLTLSERDANYGALMTGLSFDATRAQVLVEKRGAAAGFELSGTTTRFAFDGAAWTSGNTGELVLFPNVPIGTGTATLSSPDGTFVGPTAIELKAGQLTVVPLR